ncbi:Protein of unknown function, partial [Cotesia congregata]
MPYNLRKNRVLNYLLRKDCEVDDFGSDSDADEDACEVMSEEEAESDSSDSSDADVQISLTRKRALEASLRKSGRLVSILIGKNGYTWSLKFPNRSSDRSQVRSRTGLTPGPINEAANCNEIHEYWEILFTEKICQLVVDYTYLKIQLVLDEISKTGNTLQTYHHTTDLVEMNAFIGLLYHAEMWKANHVDPKHVFINAIPYKGKIQVKDGLIPEYLLRKVTEPIHGTHHSVTCDSWFTTIPLIEKMQKQPYDLTITGTIRSNKKEIPLEMKIAGEERTAKYCHHDSITLVSWTPKKKKKCISGFFLPTIYSN